MYLEHETGRKRKLDAVADLEVETDEQLARRLHEELNSLTRHGSRRLQTTVYAEQRPHASKAVKAAGTNKLSKHGAAPAVDAAIKSQPSADVGVAAVAEAEGSEAQQDRSEKPRKRSVLNRELAMLVTDMVESHVKPVTGPRSKGKDGSESQTDQQDHDRQGLQQDQQQEDHITAAKHESSSSLSEQERLAVEHLHAAGPEALANKVLVVQHTSVRTSDSGGAAGDSSTTATSSGKASSSHEHDQQQSSQHKQKQQQVAAGSVAASAVAAAVKAAAPASGSRVGYAGSRLIKIPKLPMVLYGKKWYRARVMEQGDSKVLLEYQGFSHEGGPFWLAKDHPRIWRGSYKGKDWKYLGDGAWEPKASKHDAKARQGKGKASKGGTGRGCSDAGAASAATDPAAAAADSDTEQGEHDGKESRAAAEAAAADGTASERDTTETDQEDEDADADAADADADAADADGNPVAVGEPLTIDSPSVVAVSKQQDQQQQQQEQQQQQPQTQQQEQQPPSLGGVRQHSQRQAGGMDAEQPVRQHCDLQQGPNEHQQGQLQQKQVKKQPQPQPVSADQVAQQSLQQKVAEQQAAEQPLRRRQSEPQGEAAKAADSCAAGAKTIRRGSGVASRSAGKLTTASSETAAAAAAAAIAAAMPAAPGDSSSERQTGDAAAAFGTSDVGAGRAEEAASLLATAPSRSRSTRGGRASKAADGDAAQSHGRRGSRNARGRSAAQAESAGGKQEQKPGQQGEQQQVQLPQQQQQAKQSLGLQIDASKGMKHSSSSEGLPMSPTSPVAGGSPRAHRRKGVPQRARLDSDDLQQPAHKGTGCNGATNSKSTAGGSPDVADVVEYSHDMHLDQQQQQQSKQPQQLQSQSAEQQLHLGWKGGWKGAYKKGMWQHSGEQQQAQPHQGMEQAVQEMSASCLQHQSNATDTWCPQQQHEQRQQPVGRVHSEPQPVIGGSDPEDLEAACVLVGASMGRTHSGEVFAYHSYRTSSSTVPSTAADSCSHHNQQPLHHHHHHHHHCHRYGSAAVAEEVPLSPRGYGGRQGNGRRRGHNWSKPLTRPPRAPVGQQHQQHMGALLGRRHSLNGSTSSHPQLMYGSADLCNGLMAREAAMATSPLVSRQGSLVSSPGNAAAAGGAAGHRGSDPFLLGADSDSKQQVLRHLLNAVGEMQASSGRPDLMFPLQYGGVPLGSSEQPGSHAKTFQLSMQSHLAMPAAAAALLAAVPSLDTVQHMAALHCSLNANLPSLFH